jgi:hypothetical protein
MARIPVPADKVRTPEQILEGQTVTHGGKYVWVACHNCGGSGTYPSSMTPPGMCRFYCWQDRTPETYGKRVVLAEKFVKDAQAADRRAYRAQVQWELDAPKRAEAERAAAERAEAERLERERIERDIAERKAVSQHLGTVGQRLDLDLTVTRVASYQARPYGSWGRDTVTRYVVTMRDDEGNVVVWFSEYNRTQGERLTLRGTVKEHSEYQGEKQTVIQRVKEMGG